MRALRNRNVSIQRYYLIAVEIDARVIKVTLLTDTTRVIVIFFSLAFICHENGAPCLAYVPGQQLLISGGRKGNICILQ